MAWRTLGVPVEDSSRGVCGDRLWKGQLAELQLSVQEAAEVESPCVVEGPL